MRRLTTSSCSCAAVRIGVAYPGARGNPEAIIGAVAARALATALTVPRFLGFLVSWVFAEESRSISTPYTEPTHARKAAMRRPWCRCPPPPPANQPVPTPGAGARGPLALAMPRARRFPPRPTPNYDHHRRLRMLTSASRSSCSGSPRCQNPRPEVPRCPLQSS
eukprot:COSAG06_NODE_1353_length_9753_cov_4.072405_3_plen_164_part_00